MLHLIHNYNETEQRQEARILANYMMEVRTKTSGDDNVETLNASHCLPLKSFLLGLRLKVLHLQGQPVEARKRILGEEHPKTFDSTSQLANWWNLWVDTRNRQSRRNEWWK